MGGGGEGWGRGIRLWTVDTHPFVGFVLVFVLVWGPSAGRGTCADTPNLELDPVERGSNLWRCSTSPSGPLKSQCLSGSGTVMLILLQLIPHTQPVLADGRQAIIYHHAVMSTNKQSLKIGSRHTHGDLYQWCCWLA